MIILIPWDAIIVSLLSKLTVFKHFVQQINRRMNKIFARTNRHLTKSDSCLHVMWWHILCVTLILARILCKCGKTNSAHEDDLGHKTFSILGIIASLLAVRYMPNSSIITQENWACKQHIDVFECNVSLQWLTQFNSITFTFAVVYIFMYTIWFNF